MRGDRNGRALGHKFGEVRVTTATPGRPWPPPSGRRNRSASACVRRVPRHSCRRNDLPPERRSEPDVRNTKKVPKRPSAVFFLFPPENGTKASRYLHNIKDLTDNWAADRERPQAGQQEFRDPISCDFGITNASGNTAGGHACKAYRGPL